MISPFQGSRNKALSPDDIPHTASVLAVYDLPFGKGNRWMGSTGLLDKIAGGWTLSSSMKFTSGLPFFRDSSVCGLPSQMRHRPFLHAHSVHHRFPGATRITFS